MGVANFEDNPEKPEESFAAGYEQMRGGTPKGQRVLRDVIRAGLPDLNPAMNA